MTGKSVHTRSKMIFRKKDMNKDNRYDYKHPGVTFRLSRAEVRFLDSLLDPMTKESRSSWVKKLVLKEFARLKREKRLLQEYNNFAEEKYTMRDEYFKDVFNDLIDD